MQQFGFGLAAAILLDATLIRALIVPSLMKLTGRANWWLPAWLKPLAGRGPSQP
jgi:RND superfamily putative drug exporter